MDAPVRRPLKLEVPESEKTWTAANLKRQKPPKAAKNQVNYHLSRLYPKIVGPRKRK